MSSFLGVIVGLLQSALSIIGFVQANPTLPQPIKDEAVQVAQQAVTQASNAVASKSTEGADGSPHAIFPFTFTDANALEYSDPKYGFSLLYPSTVSVETQNYTSTKPFKVDPVAYIHLSDNSQTEGYLTVNASSDMQDVSNCMETVSVVPKVSIKGTDFKRIDFGGGGASGFNREYKTFHNNICYSIEISAFPSACVNSGCEGRLWSDQTEKTLLSHLDEIAQTFILDPASADQIPGMTEYTDPDFGFSFWYPSGWVVQSDTTPDTYHYGDKVIKKRLVVSNSSHKIFIDEYTSPSRTFAVPGGACGYCGPVTIFFDPSLHQWMKAYPQGLNGAPDATQSQSDQAKISKPIALFLNTMGGLHIFSDEQKAGGDIIPLSAKNFLYVYDPEWTGDHTYEGFIKSFENTVVAADPSVAIPVSAAEQIKIIQAEKDAYVGN